MRKWLGVAALIGIGAVWLVVFRPLSLGGPASYIVVSGISMEPTLHTGDLVILHQQRDYEVGDVVAFRTGGGTVIHRIVSGDAADGFRLQGDNNPYVDWWRPVPGEILGKQMIHLPGIGRQLAPLATPFSVGLAASGLAMIGALGTRSPRRRQRGKQMHAQKADGNGGERRAGGIGGWWPGSPGLLGLLLVTTGVALVFLAIAVVAFRGTSERTDYVERLAYQHTAMFDYEVLTGPSILYPGGRLSPATQEDGSAAPPQPVFTQLARSMTVDFTYELKSDLPRAVIVELSADLVIRAGDGWTRTERLLAPRSSEGPAAVHRFTIDFAAVQATIEQVKLETGFDPRLYTLSVEPNVNVEGELGSFSINESYAPLFEIQYDETRITPPTTLASAEPVSVGDDVVSASEMSVAGVLGSVRNWRLIGVAGALAGLVVAAGIAATAYLGFGQDERAHIHARYGTMLVPVESNGSNPSARSIHVGNMKHLARLAERDGGIIFHEPGPQTYRYFVRDGDDTYDYSVAVHDGGLTAPPVSRDTEARG